MKYLTTLTLSCLLIATTMIGCESTGPIAAEPDVTSDYPNVSIANASLQDAVKLNDPTVTRTEQGLLQVIQPIRAAANEQLFIEYKFVFFDEQGRVLRPEMSWRYKRLEQRVPDTITATSTSPDADDYRMLLRWSR
jgi:uncharacterized protein YcfL